MLTFDVETTAPDPETARIVQYAIGYVGGGEETIFETVLVNPGIDIPEGATAVHGITTERAQAEGRDAREVVDILAGIFRATCEGGKPIVAFNARYDLTVLDRECRRHGVSVPDWSKARVIDPFVIDKWLDKFRRGSRKLADMCAHYGVELPEDEAHDAGADALAAARLAWVLGRRGEVVARMPDLVPMRSTWKTAREDLTLLHGLQVMWAAAQAKGLQEYFDRQGKSERVESAWPVVPWCEAEAVAA